VGSLTRRLERLEAYTPKPLDEEAEKRHWLAVARVRRNRENHDPDECRADALFRLLRFQGRLGATTEDHAQLLSWRPPPAEWAVRRVVARAIYACEECAESMVCPPAWPQTSCASGTQKSRRKPSRGGLSCSMK
jgi:hypothetical protein